MEELRKENNRLFGRLLNIYEVSNATIIDRQINLLTYPSLLEKTAGHPRPQTRLSLRDEE